MHICIHTHVRTHIYLLCATDGLYTVGCGSLIRKLMISLDRGVWFFSCPEPTFFFTHVHPGWPPHGRAPCLACSILFRRRPKHRPVSLVDFQGWLVSHPCVVPRAAALPRISLQGGDWMLQLFRCGLWDAFSLPCIPSECTWWCWVTHFNSL